MMVGTQLADGMKVLLVDDVMTAGTAVREVIPKLKAEANVEVIGLVLSVDRMEKTKDSDTSAVKAVEAESASGVRHRQREGDLRSRPAHPERRRHPRTSHRRSRPPPTRTWNSTAPDCGVRAEPRSSAVIISDMTERHCAAFG